MPEDVAVPETIQKSKGFTELAMAAVLNAPGKAIRLRQQAIGPEHILLALLEPRENVLALDLLARLGVTPETIREAVLARAERGSGPWDLELIKQEKLTPAAEQALAFARDEARRFDCPYVSTPYLLLGLLLQESLASEVLREHGVQPDLVRSIIAENPLA